MSCGPVAIVVGSEEPVVAVSYLEPIGSWDSGFAVWFADVDPDGERDEHDSELMCLHCLIGERPEVGRGLDLAREVQRGDEAGVAVLDENGEWIVAT